MGGGFDFIGAFNNHEYRDDVLKQKVICRLRRNFADSPDKKGA